MVLAVLRVVFEAGRAVLCLMADKHFNTTDKGNLITSLSVAYIINVIICGLPA